MTMGKTAGCYFFNWVINDWNNLPALVVGADSVNSLKSLLDSILVPDLSDTILGYSCTTSCYYVSVFTSLILQLTPASESS